MDDKYFIRKILIAILLGIIVGFIFRDYVYIFDVIGKIFLRLMQMVIPLLVLGQVAQAVGTFEKKDFSSLGFGTIVVFTISSLIAAYWGIMFGIILKPGTGVSMPNIGTESVKEQSINISETITSFFPKNIMESLSQGSIIQIIVFAIFLGIAINIYQQKKKDSIILTILIDFNEIVMKIIHLVMKFAPIGIFSMITVSVGKLGINILIPMMKYLIVFAVATIVFLVLWIIVVSVYCRKSIKFLLQGMKSISLVALASTSSAVTLPIAMEDSNKKLGIRKKVVDIVLPMGVSLNSNGSAMHMALTVVTISQLYSIEFDLFTILYLGILATFVSLANAVVPGAGLVSLAIIVPQLGLPIESIALFAGVEWFVGMLRTITNVNSDVFSALFVDKITR